MPCGWIAGPTIAGARRLDDMLALFEDWDWWLQLCHLSTSGLC